MTGAEGLPLQGRAFFVLSALMRERQIFQRSSRYNRPPAAVPFGVAFEPNSQINRV